MNQKVQGKSALRTGLKLLVVAAGLMLVQAVVPIFRADASGLDDSESSRHAATIFGGPGVSEIIAFPNPCHVFSNIRYQLQAPAGSVSIKIYDTSSRHIRTLPGTTFLGMNTVIWDLATDDGSGVPTGVYFVRLHVDGNHSSKVKLAVVR